MIDLLNDDYLKKMAWIKYPRTSQEKWLFRGIVVLGTLTCILAGTYYGPTGKTVFVFLGVMGFFIGYVEILDWLFPRKNRFLNYLHYSLTDQVEYLEKITQFDEIETILDKGGPGVYLHKETPIPEPEGHLVGLELVSVKNLVDEYRKELYTLEHLFMRYLRAPSKDPKNIREIVNYLNKHPFTEEDIVQAAAGILAFRKVSKLQQDLTELLKERREFLIELEKKISTL